MPQPRRYALEMDAAFAMAGGIALGSSRFGSKRARSRVATGLRVDFVADTAFDGAHYLESAIRS